MQAIEDRPQEIALSDIVATLRSRRRVLALIFAVVTIPGILYAFVAEPYYKASTIVVPVAEDDTGALSSLANQFGPAASLLGLNLGHGGSEGTENLAILRSRFLAQLFAERSEIRKYVFEDRWDARNRSWRRPNKGLLGARAQDRQHSPVGDERTSKSDPNAPTSWEFFEEFRKMRFITEDLEDGTVTVAFEARDPELAAKWANNFISLANEVIRDKEVKQAERALAFLNKEFEKTTVTGIQQTLFDLIEGQLHRIMLANARPEFAFQVIDRAVPPDRSSRPKRFLIVVLSIIGGAFLGVFSVLAFDLRKAPL